MEMPRGHVVVLTYPAQGHINPLLQFAKCLVSKRLKATFATTHYTADFIQADGIDVKQISDGYDDGGFRNAPNVEAYLNSFKTIGSRTLTELILKLNESNSSPVNCIVYDSLLPWALDVAKQFGIYAVVFLTNSASVCSLYWQIRVGMLTLPVEPEKFPLLLPGLPPLGSDEIPSFLAQPTLHSAYLAAILEQFSKLDENDWVFANTFDELEIELATAMAGLWPLRMVGPMLPSGYLDKQRATERDYGGSLWKQKGDDCSNWLEKKPSKSVIFVSFGSMAEIDVQQIEEIAWGLNISNHHFLWIVKESEQKKLPSKFLDSSNETGLILTWCNQVEVLANQAVGCFITHCGWNSTLEALCLGVPIVAMPQWSDQPMNAKFVEDVWRVGVRAKKDENGIVRREDIGRCIREVMGGERSEEIRSNAWKWREDSKRAVSNGGSSSNHLDKFVQVLMKGKGKES